MRKFWKNQRLLFKLITIVLISILTTLIVLYVLLTRRMTLTTQESEGETLMGLARQLAREEMVIETVEAETTHLDLRDYANSINENFKLDYTVFMTEDSVRLTHPNSDLILQTFQGNDQHRAFEGQEYISIGEGTLGQSLRSFAPIYNGNEEIVGAVSLGLTTNTLEQIMKENRQPLTFAFGISLLLGITLATVVAYSLKKQMLDMEPHEIARVLEERNAMLEYATDAVFVTNNEREIILKNQEAKKSFNFRDQEKDSQKIDDVLPFLRDKKIEQYSSKRGDTIYTYNNKEYVFSFAPIIVDSETVGHLYTLRDATELHMITSQLYSTSDYAHTLEAQQHDFLNKLHVIYGLTDLEEYDELKIYLEDLIEPEQEFSKRVAYLIHNPVIAGFLIGERRKFSENQLAFTIEIYPDIPASENYRYVQAWIEQVDFFNKLILEANYIIEIHLELAYFDEQIITTYRIRGNVESIRKDIIHSAYKDFIQELGNNWLTLHFEHPYEKTDYNIFD